MTDDSIVHGDDDGIANNEQGNTDCALELDRDLIGCVHVPFSFTTNAETVV